MPQQQREHRRARRHRRRHQRGGRQHERHVRHRHKFDRHLHRNEPSGHAGAQIGVGPRERRAERRVAERRLGAQRRHRDARHEHHGHHGAPPRLRGGRLRQRRGEPDRRDQREQPQRRQVVVIFPPVHDGVCDESTQVVEHKHHDRHGPDRARHAPAELRVHRLVLPLHEAPGAAPLLRLRRRTRRLAQQIQRARLQVRQRREATELRQAVREPLQPVRAVKSHNRRRRGVSCHVRAARAARHRLERGRLSSQREKLLGMLQADRARRRAGADADREPSGWCPF
mmetsp:Transcript_22214/g.77869  ORF Transcript_22214/g.77869 Transcript_22214/m.77869 type:complete len:284 (-) Transcript_22214:258-1109(-)